MEYLTEKHISEITTLIRAKGVEMEELLYDLVDHVCCMVEEKMEQGENYSSALEESMSSFGNNGIRDIQEETTYLLTKNILVMRKTMHIIGIASTIMLLVGAIFKVKHLPGAMVMYLTGGFFLSFIFLPLLLTVKIKEKLGKLRTWNTIIGVVSAFVLVNGIFFKVMHWPMANTLMNIGGVMLLFIYLPLAIYAAIKHKDIRSNTVTSIIISVGGFCTLFILVRTGNSHTVNDAIVNIQQTINNDLNEVNETNQGIYVTIYDSVKTENLIALNHMAEEINTSINELNFAIAKNEHPNIKDEELKVILSSGYEEISNDQGNLEVLRKENRLQKILDSVTSYEKEYQEITGVKIHIAYNKDNMEHYLQKTNNTFPLGIVIYDLCVLNLQIQKTHTGLLQYYKGKVS